MQCPEIVDRMYMVPAAPAAREAATSPSGCMTRLYPTGASRVGKERYDCANSIKRLREVEAALGT